MVTYITPTEPEKEEAHYLALTGDAAGKALQPADIKGMLIRWVDSLAADGSFIRVYHPYLVLNEGTIYSNPVLSPYNFNAELSKLKEPEKWGTWKIRGNVLSVYWPNRDQNEKWNRDWLWAIPAMSNERIDGSYVTSTGKDNESLLGNDKTGTARNISLNKSGQFTLISPNANGNTGVSSADYAKRNEAGTYKLNGYSIELHFNNGNVLRRAFYFYLQGQTHFGIGNYVYIPESM